MLKLRVNPLVLAASLGLLGPAALADDDERDRPAGMWRRADAGPDRGPGLGDQIEVICVEDRVLLDEGLGAGVSDAGQWTRLGDAGLAQELSVTDGHVRREFHAEGDALEVRTSLTRDGVVEAWTERYTRLG